MVYAATDQLEGCKQCSSPGFPSVGGDQQKRPGCGGLVKPWGALPPRTHAEAPGGQDFVWFTL